MFLLAQLLFFLPLCFHKAAEGRTAARVGLLVDLSMFTAEAMYDYNGFFRDTVGIIYNISQKEEKRNRSLDLSIMSYGECEGECDTKDFAGQGSAIAVYRAFGKPAESLKTDLEGLGDFIGQHGRSATLYVGALGVVLSEVYALLKRENEKDMPDRSAIILITHGLTVDAYLSKYQVFGRALDGDAEAKREADESAALYLQNFKESQKIQKQGTEMFGIGIEGGRLSFHLPLYAGTAAAMGLPENIHSPHCYAGDFMKNISSPGLGLCVPESNENAGKVAKGFLETLGNWLKKLLEPKPENRSAKGTPNVVGIVAGVICAIAVAQRCSLPCKGRRAARQRVEEPAKQRRGHAAAKSGQRDPAAHGAAAAVAQGRN